MIVQPMIAIVRNNARGRKNKKTPKQIINLVYIHILS